MSEAIYCFDTAAVKFAIYPEGGNGPRIIAEIGEDPLRHHFGATGGGDSLVEAFVSHAPEIRTRALKRYRAEPRKPVLLSSDDFALEEQIRVS
ncbi:hypothetical protein WKW79_26520 [Variovorax robiniae]|uniref:DUF1488 domain-containing protein n=1 Tax=Variovorax robiniae TaxID=1836199 RepID=A0ABU8XE76_9BURK